MNIRHIATIVKPPTPHFVGDGFRVHNFIPSEAALNWQRMSPFLLLDYNAAFYFSPTSTPRGVGVHPHRGFETVTIAYKGSVEHHDSTGNGGIINEGDVQWMTAASGILHKEYHEKEFSKKGGVFHMVQLWINLPAKDKMTQPKYQAIKNSNIKTYPIDENGSKVEVIAGNYKEIKGAAATFTPVELYNIYLKKKAKAHFSLPKDFNTGLLVVEGVIKVNNHTNITTDSFGLLENSGTDFTILAEEDSIILLLSGEPIHEPIAAQGPFVMNTKKEIEEAFHDYQQGKFGFLED